MSATVRALTWEILWKNWIIFPALMVLLGFGFFMAETAAAGAAAGHGWEETARTAGFIFFLTSLLLVYSPFTLIENHHGWRMNSMTTRWYALPVPTWLMVSVPLLMGWALITVLAGSWWPVLRRLLPGADFTPLFALLFLLMTLVQVLAWITARKPIQFWALMAVVSVGFLYYLLVWSDSAHSKRAESTRLLIQFVAATVVIAGIGGYVARQLRCGAWPGYLPFEHLFPVGDRPGSTRAVAEQTYSPLQPSISPCKALFRSEALPLLRVFFIGLFLIVIASVLLGWLSTGGRHGARLKDPADTFFAVCLILQFGVIFWLAPGGLVAACDAPMVFQTQLSSFRGTQPVSAGALVAPRLLALLIAWAFAWLLLLWAPLTATYQRYASTFMNLNTAGVYSQLAIKMVLSAHAMAGALPLLLRGRFEGVPNLVLITLASWAGTYYLSTWLLGGPENPPQAWAVGVLLIIKFGVTAWALAKGLQTRQITWRFALALPGLWLLLAGALAIAGYQHSLDRAAAILVLLPLTRLALSPLAMAANRHR